MKKKHKKIFLVLGISMMLIVIPVMAKKKNLFVEEDWLITQYGPRDINSSFYTIYHPKKGLIVVDGGWVEDAQYVRDIIGLAGNKVNAWILTHPHQDHIGAFNVIYEEPQGMEIGQVYAVNMATPQECQEVASWDSVDAYEEFLNLQVKDLKYVNAGDELVICGLKFQIFNAFGEYVKQYSRDYLNDGSMMFKVTAKEQSMLFCADVGVNMSDYLQNRWKEELHSDYLQMAHHGFGGLKDEFYHMVSPKVTFFDAPAHMMEDETGRFDNPRHEKMMQDMGSQVYSFIGGPLHSVKLK